MTRDFSFVISPSYSFAETQNVLTHFRLYRLRLKQLFTSCIGTLYTTAFTFYVVRYVTKRWTFVILSCRLRFVGSEGIEVCNLTVFFF